MPVIASAGPVGSAVGRYACQADMERRFGADNIRVWSQLDSSLSSADELRIASALTFADARISSIFAQFGNYATPLNPQGSDVEIVRGWAVLLAAAWLHESRGISGNDTESNQINALRDLAEQQMLEYRGSEKLNAVRRWPVANSPIGY